MGRLLSALALFFNPVITFCAAMAAIVAFLLGALANPQGLMNQIICRVIDYIAMLFPSTPPSLTVAGMLQSASTNMPAFGSGVIREVLSTLAIIFGLSLVVKIYKLLPFKAT
jgi:hypothetical protein